MVKSDNVAITIEGETVTILSEFTMLADQLYDYLVNNDKEYTDLLSKVKK